jgi:hypothetical protein
MKVRIRKVLRVVVMTSLIWFVDLEFVLARAGLIR